jgi:hypothetical protein
MDWRSRIRGARARARHADRGLTFQLDENLSPALAGTFTVADHEAHSILKQSLGGKCDARLIDVCAHEGRALITLDLDFANIQQYPPSHYSGIVVGVSAFMDQDLPKSHNIE